MAGTEGDVLSPAHPSASVLAPDTPSSTASRVQGSVVLCLAACPWGTSFLAASEQEPVGVTGDQACWSVFSSHARALLPQLEDSRL